MDNSIEVFARKFTVRVTSPLRLFVLLLTVLFVAEAIIMFLLPILFPIPDSPLVNFADSLILITLSAPFIWVLIVQPLRNAVKTEVSWATALLERVVDGVLVFDRNGKVTSLNPSAERIFGYSSAEVHGHPLQFLLSGQGDKFADLLAPHGADDHARPDYPVSHEFLGRRNNGVIFPMDFSLSKVSLAGETAYIGIVHDTTERKQIEAALIEKQHQLTELNVSLEERVVTAIDELRAKDRLLLQHNRLAAMGELLNNIAHQWRQPLNTLGLIVQQLQLDYDSGKLEKKLLAASTGNAFNLIKQLSRTIDSFRNFFRPDSEKCSFQVDEAIDQAIGFLDANLKEHRIELAMDRQGNPRINGYKNEYAQVILNGLLNARDVLIEQQVDAPRIKITSFVENNFSVVAISDNGGGIRSDLVDKIFDPYFTTKGPRVGLGLGLFMAKNIIENSMHGRISVGNFGDGAEFRIEVLCE